MVTQDYLHSMDPLAVLTQEVCNKPENREELIINSSPLTKDKGEDNFWINHNISISTLQSQKVFESVANELVEKINDNKDGVVYYHLYKKDDITYVFLERYKDDEALAIHRKTDYFKAIGAQMGAFMTVAPDVQLLQSVSS